MKRSPLQRKTPIKRGKPPRRVGRLKARSMKRAREDRQCNDLAEFADLFIGGPCWYRLPGCTGVATDVDHALGRPNNPKRHSRAHLMAACNACNLAKVSIMETREEWRQLKIKNDPEGYDEEVWNELLSTWEPARKRA